MSINLREHFDSDLLKISSTVERVAYASRNQLEELTCSNRPAILTGALEDWPALAKWSPEYFRERWGSRTLYGHETTWHDRLPYESSVSENATIKTVADFIDHISKDENYALYADQIPAAEIFPGTLDDLRYSDLLDSPRQGMKLQPNIWMGTSGTRSGLHFDAGENLIAMFYGSKAFMLVDPSSPRLLYPSRSSPTKSRIDPKNVDWKAFPRLAKAKIYTDVLRPGETLFLPRNWWHYFTALQFTINASCWFSFEGQRHSASRSYMRDYLSYLLRCGPSYPLQLVYEMLWHGFLRRPYERKALTPPPIGIQIWKHLWRGAD